jgi:peptide/nickel transport system ATP-binding protein
MPMPAIHPSEPPILELQGVSAAYGRGGALTRARQPVLRGITLSVRRGEAMGLLGESGSGKSTLGRVILGLLPVLSGTMRFDGQEVPRRTGAAWRDLRRRIQVVFQDSNSSLHPSHSILWSLTEPMRIHGVGTAQDREARALAMLADVGLEPGMAGAMPRSLSGGQRQRVGIARALMLSPELIVADEPVSALDVSVQAQVLNLLKSVQQKHGLTILFISHDMAVVEAFCDRAAVMAKGELVEIGIPAELFRDPKSEATRRLCVAPQGMDPHLPL